MTNNFTDVQIKKLNGECKFKSLVVKNLNNADKIGRFHATDGIVATAETCNKLLFDNGIYIVYNLDQCLLVVKKGVKISDTKYVFNNLIGVDGDYLCGFFDYNFLSDFLKNDPDHDCESSNDELFMCEIRKLKKTERKNGCAIRGCDLVLNKFKSDNTNVVGCVIDTKCGTAFPLSVFVSDNSALILTGEIIEKLINAQ